MEPFRMLSDHTSSNASVRLEYLDGLTPRSPSAVATDAFPGSPVFPAFPVVHRLASPSSSGRSQRNAAAGAAARGPFDLSKSPSPSPPLQPVAAAQPAAVQPVWRRALRGMAEGAGALVDRLLAGTSAPEQGSAADPQMAVQIVHIDASEQENINEILSMANGADLEDEEDNDDEALTNTEPLRFEVDLKSALRGYRKNPSECLKHLVGAALLSRSAENPVTGDELREAQRHPFLVRMIVESGALDTSDPVAREEVCCCVDEILPTEAHHVLQCVYDYLPPLFRLPFVRLKREQYILLRSSGFEFVQLLCEYPHVLPPDKFNLTSINYGCIMRNVDLFLMVFSTILNMFCLLSMGLTVAYWTDVKEGKYINFGFYTITIYGFGFTLHFLSMIFLMRGKERDVVYGEMLAFFPNPNLHVVPLLPLFDFVSIFTYLRYHLSASASQRYVAVMHDIVAAQTLTSLCFVFCVAIPQLIAQTYMTLDNLFVPADIGRGTEYALLTLSSILLWLLALMRLFKEFTMGDSISCFGFACFGFHYDSIIERYSAVPRSIYASCLFVLELNMFFIISGSFDRRCVDPVTLSLASISTFIMIVMFYFLLLSRETVFRILWSILPLTLAQIVLVVYHEKYSPEEGCILQNALRYHVIVFRFFIWAMYFLLLVILVLQFILFVLMKRMRTGKMWQLWR